MLRENANISVTYAKFLGGVMKAAKFSARPYNEYRRHMHLAVRRYIRLARSGTSRVVELQRDQCPHDWVLEGQTLAGNVLSCSICKRLKFT